MTTNLYQIGMGLRSIRRRRKMLWIVIGIYFPQIWLTIEFSGSNTAVTIVFIVWFIMLWNCVMLVAFAKCPSCDNYFHIKSFFPTYHKRHCLHCGLSLRADLDSESI
ncbi:MAG: hypothetical protein FPO08_06875 [Geobacter sp.]|nr:MAG: hypothetical protein FPO08_06875 [Geobacter sp.]